MNTERDKIGALRCPPVGGADAPFSPSFSFSGCDPSPWLVARPTHQIFGRS